MRHLYAVSDVHGNYEALKKALEQAGLLIPKPGRGLVKKKDVFILQLGDLANGVENSRRQDLECLKTVGDWIDLMVVGNHEMPYFDPDNTFHGFVPYPEISEKLWQLFEAELIDCCYRTESGILLSHAGITRQQLSRSADAHILQRHWRNRNFNMHLFRDCGRARYGRAEVGGMLWCDFNEEFEPTGFPQIVGHTPGIPRFKGNAVCIDTIAMTGLPTVMKVD